MNIYDYLKKDHQAVNQLFEKILSTQNPYTKDALFGKLKKELLLHAHAEQTIFYKELARYSECQSEIVHATSEHKEIENLLKTIASLSPWDDLWSKTVARLRDTVQQHVKEEEGQIFSIAKKFITNAKANELTEYMKDYKQEMEHGKMQMM